MLREIFLTPGGTIAYLRVVAEGPITGRDSLGIELELSVGGITRRVNVSVDALVSCEGVSSTESPDVEVDKDPRRVLAILAVLERLDTDVEFARATDATTLELNAESASKLLTRGRLSDRELRRYLARWVYTVYSNHTLEVHIDISRIDELVTHSRRIDVDRNVHLLTAEGYFDVSHRRRGTGDRTVRATPRLIREVERYGAAKEDVVAEHDYLATLSAYPLLGSVSQPIALEWSRYNVARSAPELVSVFRALAPLVETVVRLVLVTHGSKRAETNLGPMIGEMERRGIGDRALWSKLNHIVLFARDLAEHGAELSEPVLRIAAESAFELVPQLAALARPSNEQPGTSVTK